MNKVFRVWDTKSQTMSREFELLDAAYEGFPEPITDENGEFDTHANIIVMQWTGMYAKDGDKIFEGDIVRRGCLDENCNLEHTGEVLFSETWGMWGINDKSQSFARSETGGYPAPLAWGDPANKMIMGLEKLGNVYQNPELN